MRVILVFLFTVMLVLQAQSTTIRPFENLGEMAKASPAVVLAEVVRNFTYEENGSIFYQTELRVVNRVKGEIQKNKHFVIQHIRMTVGEYERSVWGDLEVEEGKTYLLYLNPLKENLWQPLMLSYGAFELVESGDESFLVPFDLGAEVIITKTANGRKAQTLKVYKTSRLLKHLRDIVSDQAVWEQSNVVADRALSSFAIDQRAPPGQCTFLAESPIARWSGMQSNGMPVYSHQAGVANCTNTAMKIQGAIDDLNTDYEGVNLVYGGTHNYVPSTCTDGANGADFIAWVNSNVGQNSIVVQYEDPCDEIANLSGCSGTLAVGGLYFFSSQYQAQGMTWKEAAYGYVIVNEGVGTCQCGSTDFKVMITHEMSHSLNIGHIANGDGVANMNGLCCNDITTVDIECLDFIYDPAGIIPVELGEFIGKAENAHSKLSWSTFSEINNEEFQIERLSSDDVWNQIGAVKGAGTSTSVNDYKFLDRAPRQGINYYRLKQMDFDQAFEYSKIIAVDHKRHGQVKFYPNPTNDVIYVEGARKGNFQIFNQMGKQVGKGLVENSIDLSEFSDGVYFIKLESAGEVYTKRLIKF